MKYLLILLLLSGCATKPEPKIEYVPVMTPVPMKLEIPRIERPQLMIDLLTDVQKGSDGEVAKAYLASLLQVISYAEALEAVLDSLHIQQEKQENGKFQPVAPQQ